MIPKPTPPQVLPAPSRLQDDQLARVCRRIGVHSDRSCCGSCHGRERRVVVPSSAKRERAQRQHARKCVQGRHERASESRSLFVSSKQVSCGIQQVLFLANKQVSCGIQQVSCGMRVALLILMAVKLLSRTGCKIIARCSHGLDRRSGTRACCGSLPAQARPIVSQTTCACYPPATAPG